MRIHAILATVAAISALFVLPGCGGGNDDNDNGGDGGSALRKVLAGDGGTSGGGPTTFRRWRTTALKVNGNFVGTGADQPCPVEVDHKIKNESISCDPTQYADFRSDGVSRTGSAADGPDVFDDSWSLSGSVLDATTNVGGARVVARYQVTDEGIVNGRHRLRLRVISVTEDDGVTPDPDDPGFEYLIEDITGEDFPS